MAVRKAMADRSLAGEASRWARSMVPRGDGTATVQMQYVRNNPFGRRNAEGVSLQFCSKALRERIAGKYYSWNWTSRVRIPQCCVQGSHDSASASSSWMSGSTTRNRAQSGSAPQPIWVYGVQVTDAMVKGLVRVGFSSNQWPEF